MIFSQQSTEACSGDKSSADTSAKNAGGDADRDKAGGGDDDDDDDDEEERFVDLPLPAEFQEEDVDSKAHTGRPEAADSVAEESVAVEEATAGGKAKPQKGVSSWVHRQNLTGWLSSRQYS